MSESTCYYYDEQYHRCNCYVNKNLNELLDENAKLRELGEQYETVLADYRSEVAKLRDELAKWERLAVGIDLPEYPVTQFKSKDLERENAKLRELATRYDELQFGAVKAVTMPSDMGSVLHEAADTILSLRDRAQDLQTENAKLRELVALWSVINKHMSLCATTDCKQCPVREECEESVYLEGLLGIDPKGLSWRVQERMAETTNVQVENSKLRELVRDMWSYINAPVNQRNSLKERLAIYDDLADCMRELGVDE